MHSKSIPLIISIIGNIVSNDERKRNYSNKQIDVPLLYEKIAVRK